MHVGFIGLGNVGGKLSGSLFRNGVELSVHDLDQGLVNNFVKRGARDGKNPQNIMETCDVVITCLPSPSASNEVMQQMIDFVVPGKVWLEMSTTDEAEVRRLGALVVEKGGARVLHTGELGSASILKVITNYLATANLVSCAEALTVAKGAGMDLSVAYKAFSISSGNSFVNETESQVILNGSRDISFTMDLVAKDIGLFQAVADRAKIPLELNPLLISIFADGIKRFGPRELSPNIIKRLEEATGLDIRAAGFPAQIVDDEPEEIGYEVTI
jgi:3-hydroxyisobutyrate dehydrogenase